MAVQYDPIAKDESLNTTESPSRNVADVLAQGLDAIEQAIAGAGIDASDVTYGGGTVEDALDDAKIFYKDFAIAGLTTSTYELSIPLGVSPSDYTAISFTEGGTWSADYTVSLLRSLQNEFRLALRSKASTYTVPSWVMPVRVFFVKTNRVNATPLP